MNRTDKTCATCAHYSVKAAPQGTPAGRGLCQGYEPDPVRREPTVAFDAPSCVLWRRPADMQTRLQYVDKMKGPQRERLL